MGLFTLSFFSENENIFLRSITLAHLKEVKVVEKLKAHPHHPKITSEADGTGGGGLGGVTGSGHSKVA